MALGAKVDGSDAAGGVRSRLLGNHGSAVGPVKGWPPDLDRVGELPVDSLGDQASDRRCADEPEIDNLDRG